MPDPLYTIRNLRVYFPIRKGILFQRTVGHVKAVDDLSLEIFEGETLGLVGESGCGKSTTGRAILRLIPANAGAVNFRGTNISSLDVRGLRKLRRHFQMIFQDPFSALNPRLSVGEIIAEPLKLHTDMSRNEIKTKVVALMGDVGLQQSYVGRYPHEFSGGQRQRIGIARALALQPSFIVCDEPVSALDVSIQAQIINLLEELQDKYHLTYLFISHDLSVVRHISDRIAVMYLGKLIELTDRDALYERPLHPYTQALLSAIPLPEPAAERRKKKVLLVGDMPSPANPPRGCNFCTRCHRKREVNEKFGIDCDVSEPEMIEYRPGHRIACHLYRGET
ncbi:MAG: ABC transporter ATP-binding protein [Gammaproteobacteria bacterium]